MGFFQTRGGIDVTALDITFIECTEMNCVHGSVAKNIFFVNGIERRFRSVFTESSIMEAF